MNDALEFPSENTDPWTIPLHGAAVPIPPSADPPTPPPPPLRAPGGDAATILDFPGLEEIPSDVGFHPHLRRSA